jgi:hypothetical protein
MSTLSVQTLEPEVVVVAEKLDYVPIYLTNSIEV